MSDIQDIKEKHGQAAESIISNGLNLIKKNKSYRCPNTYAHKNGDKNPSMSWDDKALQFYCFGCGMKIDIYGYYREHLNYSHQEVLSELLGKDDYTKTTMQSNRDKFISNTKNVKDLTPECIKYMQSRKITVETMKYFKLKSYNGEIAFPYIKYETVIGYKTRKPLSKPPKPKYGSIGGSKPYLFNSQNVEGTEELIIVEGEFDCMIVSQSGFTNVVSVGAGANSVETLIEQSKDFLNKFNILIIMSDNDIHGNEMDASFIKEFGDKAKLVDKKIYGYKDANEEYFKFGKEKIEKIIESGRFKIEGRRDLDAKPYKGLDCKTGKYIPTGLETIDNAINDLAPGCLTLLTGRSNGGKTTLTKQVMANAIDKGNKVYLMSGEGDTEMLINELYQCVVGRNINHYDTIKINKRFRKEPKQEVLKALQEWHKGKFTIFNKGESKLKTMDELFKMIEFEIKINKFDLIIIDNLMSILSVQASDKLEAQADFVQRLHDLANSYNTHIILVLHPNKSYRKGQNLDFELIAGSMDMVNKADNIINVIREYDEEKIAEGISGQIEVTKNRYYTDIPSIDTHFERDTGLLLEKNESSYLAYGFTWEKYLIAAKNMKLRPEYVKEVEEVEDCPF